MQIRTWNNRGVGGVDYFQNQCHRKIGKGKEVSFPKPFLVYAIFISEILKIGSSAPRLRHSNTSGFLSDTKASMQPLHSLTPPMLDPGDWSHLFLNWSGTTARQLSLTGLHYFRVTKHWEMVITGSACPRLRGSAGLSHTTLCLRKEPQPERSKSQNGKETLQLLPCSESPTPPSAHVWPCCYGHCTQPPPLADHPHCGYKSEHLFLKNTKATTSLI